MGLSIGKLRGLQRIAGDGGLFTMCALDHRGSLAEMLCHGMPPGAWAGKITAFKQELCDILSPHASAVLLDPVYAAAQCISAGLVAPSTGVLVSLEETGYGGAGTARETTLLPGWSVAKAKLMGADAAKLLVYYRPDVPGVTDKQLEVIRRVAADCQRQDLLCLVECLSYPAGDETRDAGLYARHKPGLVIQTARDITPLAIDVLKAEFPANLSDAGNEKAMLEYCHRLDEASVKPWVILSAGVDYPTFERQVELACRAGASGYLAGRAIWQEAVSLDEGAVRRRFLETVAVARLEKLADIARRWATPWYRKMGLRPDALAAVAPDWYVHYSEPAP